MRRSVVRIRILTIILVLLFCIPQVNISAADTVCEAVSGQQTGAPAVFVADGGTGDGSSADSPMASLAGAFSALSETGGYVVICGDVTITTSNYNTPWTEHAVTVTSKYGGVDYRSSGAELYLKIASFFHSADVKYEYLNIKFSKATNIYMQYNDLFVGEEVNTYRAVSTGTYRYPILIGGKVMVTGSNTVANASNSRDTVMRIDSGTWDTAFCGNYRSAGSHAVGNNSGRSALIINGGHFNRTQDTNFPVSASGMNYFSGDVYLEINGGTFDTPVYGVMRVGTMPSDSTIVSERENSGNVLVRITGGVFNNTVGLTREHNASAGNDAYTRNHVVNGDSTFVITGGVFTQEFITYCACGDLLLKYDPARVQAGFTDLCINFPIKQKINSADTPDTSSEYVRAEIDQQIDKFAHGADPYVIKDPHDDCYYYVYSSGGVKITKSGNIGMFKQGTTAASSTTGVNSFTKIYNGIKIVNATEYAGTDHSTQYWAPEIHYIPREVAGEDYGWYCYVAASDASGTDDTHRMHVFKCPDPEDPMTEGWEYKGKITDSSDFWAIDGTVICKNGEMYFAWSGRESADCSANAQNICIAKMKNPWTLSENRTILSTPSRSWERYETSPAVNEGPQAFEYNGTLYLTYSANGSWAKNYCVGILTYDGTGTLSDASNWTKRTSAPFFQKNNSLSSSPYGTGHGSVIMSLDGTPWLVFHANPTLETSAEASWWARRMIYAQPLTIPSDGGLINNYAQSTSAVNTVTAHNGEYCTEHMWAGFDYPVDACLYCGHTRDTALSGDIDLDRYVTNADITLVVRYLSGWGEPTAYCDINGDGKVSNRDAIELIMRIG